MKRRKVYLILQALICITLAALLSACAVSIYREGTTAKAQNPLEIIYKPGIVAEKLAPILPILFEAAGFMNAGLVLGVRDEEAEKPVSDAGTVRDLTVRRIRRPSDAMRREQKAQRRLLWIGCSVFALCMIPVAVFFGRPENFPADDPEFMFRGLAGVLLPWTAVGLGALAVTSAMRERSILRETEAADARLKEEQAEGVPEPAPLAVRAQNRGPVQAVFIAAAVTLILAGIFNGSARDVLYKAITICTECVGLG